MVDEKTAAGMRLFQTAVWDVAQFHQLTFVGFDTAIGTRVAYMHSEVSELFDSHRRQAGASPKVPAISHMAEELADIFLLTLMEAERNGIDLLAAAQTKLEHIEEHGKDQEKYF